MTSETSPLFKPMSVLAGVLGGMVATKLFTRLWCTLTGDDEAPSAESTEHRTSRILVAAVLQGAIAGAVRALMTRAGAKGLRTYEARSARAL